MCRWTGLLHTLLSRIQFLFLLRSWKSLQQSIFFFFFNPVFIGRKQNSWVFYSQWYSPKYCIFLLVLASYLCFLLNFTWLFLRCSHSFSFHRMTRPASYLHLFPINHESCQCFCSQQRYFLSTKVNSSNSAEMVS